MAWIRTRMVLVAVTTVAAAAMVAVVAVAAAPWTPTAGPKRAEPVDEVAVVPSADAGTAPARETAPASDTGPDGAAPAPVEPTTTTAGTDTTATAVPSPAPAPVSGAGGPVTTVAGTGPVDPAGIYRGVVGALGPHDPVVAAVAAAPTVDAGVQPLTGWAGPVPDRPAAVVKIDNSGPARPQTGIEAADVIFEEEVEGGVTRLAAVFHSQGGVVGPVRSGRTTDIPMVVSLDRPLLLYSGANEVTDALLRRQEQVQNRAANRSSGYWRETARKAPSNLYTDLNAHWASATGGPPPAQFSYRQPGVAAAGTPVTGLAVNYRANPVSWTWNGELWTRNQGGRAHTVAAGGQLAVANVVVVLTERVDTGMVDSSGATVPEFVYVGRGAAWVYSDGRRLEGIWTRPTLASPATLTTPDGAVIALTPGRTWVQVVGAGDTTFRP